MHWLALRQSDLLLTHRRCSRLLSPGRGFASPTSNTAALGPRAPSNSVPAPSEHGGKAAMLAGSGEMKNDRGPRAAQAFVKLTLPRPGLCKLLGLWPKERAQIASLIPVFGQLPISVPVPLYGRRANITLMTACRYSRGRSSLWIFVRAPLAAAVQHGTDVPPESE